MFFSGALDIFLQTDRLQVNILSYIMIITNILLYMH